MFSYLLQMGDRQCAVLTALVLCICLANAQSPLVKRNLDPVVIPGDRLSCLIGVAPASIVAYRYDNGWTQIPVQVDELVKRDFTAPYGPLADSTVGASFLFFADSLTYVGPDTNTLFDSDDEIVCMARDLGYKLETFYNPPAVVPGSCCLAMVLDTLNQDTGYVYFFAHDGSLTPDADTSYVDYDFCLIAGTYPDDYNLQSGPNPENSTISTPYYSLHFSDRWICDTLQLFHDSANGTDILDRHQNFYAPGNCARTEDTFSAGEGCFVTNKNGPVRAIRSYLGANSGPLTQRRHYFYEAKHELETFLRVHAIQSVYDVYDFNLDAYGMIVYTNLDTTGSQSIDGQPEIASEGDLVWELIEGTQGSLVISHMVTGTFDPDTDGMQGYYWHDDVDDMASSCTGDMLPIGTTGPYIIFNPGICTDPVACAGAEDYRTLSSRRLMLHQGPGMNVTQAMELDVLNRAPVDIESSDCCTVQTTVVWTGIKSTSWYDRLNWHCGGVPDSMNFVEILPANHVPVIFSGHTARCRLIEVNSATHLTVSSQAQLFVMKQ